VRENDRESEKKRVRKRGIARERESKRGG